MVVLYEIRGTFWKLSTLLAQNCSCISWFYIDFISDWGNWNTALLVIKSKRYHYSEFVTRLNRVMWGFFYDKREENRFQIRFNIFCARIFIYPFRAFAPMRKARSLNLRCSHRPRSLKQWQFIRKTLSNSVETWWVFWYAFLNTHSDSGRPVLGHTVKDARFWYLLLSFWK